MHMSRKAEMGIGSLIVFITLLLIATTAASFIIAAAGEVQEKELIAMKHAQKQVSTNIRVVEVSGSDARDGTVTNITMIMKLAGGSDDIKFDDAFLEVMAYDSTATLVYSGRNGTTQNSIGGYWTLTSETPNTETIVRSQTTAPAYDDPQVLGIDYDRDNVRDQLTGGLEGQMAYVSLSSGASVAIGYCNASGTFVTNVSDTTYISRSQTDPFTCTGNLNLTGLYLERQTKQSNFGKGFYSIEYIHTGTNPSPGNLQRGDMIRLYFQAPEQIGNEETVTIRFVPKFGTPTLTQFRTPEGMAEERVFLYP